MRAAAADHRSLPKPLEGVTRSTYETTTSAGPAEDEPGHCLPVNRPKLERLGKLLQPEIRDPALAETFWELAGADLADDTSELALVGQILDDARVTLGDTQVEMELFVAR